jgi:hypothetical protein
MRVQSKAVLVALAVSLGGCADRGRAARESDASWGLRPNDRQSCGESEVGSRIEWGEKGGGRGVDAPLVLVTIDGVRWQEVFGGTDPVLAPPATPRLPAASLVPHLYKLGYERGAFIGAPGQGTISASGPNYVSLPGYTEILGGRQSAACQSNNCERTKLPTILDEARAAGAKVAVFSSWDPLALAASASPGAFHMSCGQGGGPGAAIDPYPGYGSYRPDFATADAALAYYQAERPDVLFVGLGDTDEYAHRGDYARYIRALEEADAVVGRIMDLLDHDGERGARTHLVVTADHGRARDFQNHGAMSEAARVWMVAGGPRFRARGPIPSPRERHLADVVPTLRTVLGLAPDRSTRAGRPIDELFVAPRAEEVRAASL